MRGHGTEGFYKTFKPISSRSLILNVDVIWRRADKSLHLGSAIFDFITYKTLRICQNFLSVHKFICQRTCFYIFQNFNTSLTYREFNLGRHSTLKKKWILRVWITASLQFASLWNFGHPHIFVLVLNHYLNSRLSKMWISTESVFIAYKRESWQTNQDDLHLIWDRLRSAAGAMFHCRFLVLQTVSSQANYKVIHCIFYTTYDKT